MAVINPYAQLGNKLQQVAWLSVPCKGIGHMLYYLVTFRFLVTFADWLRLIAASIAECVVKLLLAAGKCAESLFIIATCYVISVFVAHSFMRSLIGDKIMGNGNQIALLIFSALPELIIWDAVATSVERCTEAIQSKRIVDWMWAGITVAPTLVFAGMTVVTICNFTSLESASQSITQVTGLALIIRVLAGWIYATVNGLYNRIGKRSKGQSIDATGHQNSVSQTPDIMQLVNDLRAEMQSSLSSLEAQKPVIDYAEIVSHMMPTLNDWRTDIVAQVSAKVDSLEAQIPQVMSVDELALQLVPLLAKVEQEVTNQEIFDVNESEESSQVKSEETRGNVVNFRVSSQSRKQSTKRRASGQQMSETESKIRKLLAAQKLTPSQIAQRVGVNPSYVSKIKGRMKAGQLA